MEDKIIKIAVGLPHLYPWTKKNFSIEEDVLNEMLLKYNLDTYEKRRLAGWYINASLYKEVLTSNSAEELLKTIVNASNDVYLNDELIRDILTRKKIGNDTELAVFKGFIKNTLTIEQKNKNERNIIIWLVELVTFYMLTKDPKVKYSDITTEVEKIIQNNFNEIDINKEKIEDTQRRQGFNRDENIKLIVNNFKDKNEVYYNLLVNYLKCEKKLEDKEETLEDSLFDILNDIDDSFTMELEEVNSNTEKKIKKEKEVKNIEKNISTKEEKKIKNEIETINYKEVESNLKVLAKSLGLEVVSSKYNTEDEDREVQILKDLASLKKGAVLSELYNAYKNINNISKENLEAVISNFFTALKVQGFEVDDENLVGDKITVDTKDILNEFVFSHSISAKGSVEGTIEYLSWNYKGKKVTPMVVKPNK